jgi:gliding motility-associated-like protein
MKSFLLTCFFAIAVCNFLFAQCPPISITASPNCQTGVVQLQADSGLNSYLWTPALGLSNDTIYNPIAFSAGTYVLTTTLLGPNLIVNPDFSLGNVGFNSGHFFTTNYSPCNYYVDSLWFSNLFANFNLTDHTATADNRYMQLDGCTSITMIWEETNIPVQPNTNYAFSFWASRADQVQPIFEMHFIGNSTGNTILNTVTGIPYTGVWTWDQYGVPVWNSGANTSVTIQILNLETNGFGNDFGLDDFSFQEECTRTDTVQVTMQPPLANVLGNDTSLCSNTTMTIMADSADTYLWNTGSSNPSITITSSGIYSLIATINGCTVFDTIEVRSIPTPNLGDDLSLCDVSNTLLDAGHSGGTYLWNTGQTSQTISATGAGVYWVQITENNCVLSDTIALTSSFEGSNMYFPNTFTPNEDTQNDYFTGYGIDVVSFHMQIFNRWGELIFQTTDMNTGWDGRCKGEYVQEDTYVYVVDYQLNCSELVIKNKRGHVNVLR